MNWNGGGIYCYESSPSLVNVTITGNNAWYGGGIYCVYNSNPSLLNSIFWNNTPEEVYFREDNNPNSITISYSDIQGGEAGIVTNNNGTVIWLEGNIYADPLFVGAGVYPYSLLEDSPCIDAGNPDQIYYDPEDPANPDYALYPAMGTIINDMGAYGGPNAIGWPGVGLDDNVIVQTPEVLLHQNYPNPFNPTTNIQFDIKELETGILRIFNIKGQSIESHRFESGKHNYLWDATEQSSGIYLYKLQTETITETRKMLLLK